MAGTTETPVLDLLAGMTTASIEASSLDPETLMLVRIAALVAVDAPPVRMPSIWRRQATSRSTPSRFAGSSGSRPIVGTPRIASATGNIVRALELAELEEEIADSSTKGIPRGRIRTAASRRSALEEASAGAPKSRGSIPAAS